MRKSVHRGQIVEQRVREAKKTNKTLTVKYIAEQIGYVREMMYEFFNREELDWEIVVNVGAVINHDFSEDFPEMKEVLALKKHDLDPSITSLKKEVDYWRNKYVTLSEELNEVNKKYIALLTTEKIK